MTSVTACSREQPLTLGAFLPPRTGLGASWGAERTGAALGRAFWASCPSPVLSARCFLGFGSADPFLTPLYLHLCLLLSCWDPVFSAIPPKAVCRGLQNTLEGQRPLLAFAV